MTPIPIRTLCPKDHGLLTPVSMFTSVDVDVGVVAVQSGHTLKQPDASSPTACEHCSVGYRALRDVWVGRAASCCPRTVVVGKMKCVTSPKGGVLVTSSWAVNPVGGYTAVSVTHGSATSELG